MPAMSGRLSRQGARSGRFGQAPPLRCSDIKSRQRCKRAVQQRAEVSCSSGGDMADKQAKETAVANKQAPAGAVPPISRGQLVESLNENLAREYQAVIAYVIYSQVLKGT